MSTYSFAIFFEGESSMLKPAETTSATRVTIMNPAWAAVGVPDQPLAGDATPATNRVAAATRVRRRARRSSEVTL